MKDYKPPRVLCVGDKVIVVNDEIVKSYEPIPTPLQPNFEFQPPITRKERRKKERNKNKRI